jgi:hypothetical protein
LQGLSVDNLGEVLSLSEAYSAPQLAKACCLFALKEVDELTKATEDNPYSFCQLMERVMPVLKSSLVEDLSKDIPDDMEVEVAEADPAAAAVQAAAAQVAALGAGGDAGAAGGGAVLVGGLALQALAAGQGVGMQLPGGQQGAGRGAGGRFPGMGG